MPTPFVFDCRYEKYFCSLCCCCCCCYLSGDRTDSADCPLGEIFRLHLTFCHASLTMSLLLLLYCLLYHTLRSKSHILIAQLPPGYENWCLNTTHENCHRIIDQWRPAKSQNSKITSLKFLENIKDLLNKYCTFLDVLDVYDSDELSCIQNNTLAKVSHFSSFPENKCLIKAPISQVSRKVEKDKTSSYECQGPVEDDCDHEQI